MQKTSWRARIDPAVSSITVVIAMAFVVQVAYRRRDVITN
jgi:hypothetical protein